MTGLAAAHLAQDHWRVVAPWYRWDLAAGSDPGRAAQAGRPALHKYTSTEFVADFLADPQRSVAFGPVDQHHRVETIPDSELLLNGRRRFLSDTRLVADGTRKLFQPAHQRFYIAAVGLHCDRPGFPKLAPDGVAQVGFVIRRRRVAIPDELLAAAAIQVQTVTAAQVTAQTRAGMDLVRQQVHRITPFRSSARNRVRNPSRTTVSALREVERARRQLRVWAQAEGLATRTEGWVLSDDGRVGSWVALPDQAEELVERIYPMRRLPPPPDDPTHAGHEATLFYGVVPTSSDEVTRSGAARFNHRDTYELHVFVRGEHGRCPGPLTWSPPGEPFRIAAFTDPDGCAQRPTEIQMPDLGALAASTALPSVRVDTPDGSRLEVPHTGEIPEDGEPGGQQICFFSIPLITIVAMFLLNLFLPIVMFVFGLWWMLKLKFCLPPSLEVEADITAALSVLPGGLTIEASLDVDIDLGLTAQQSSDLDTVLAAAWNPPAGDPGEALGDTLVADFTADPLVELLARQGYGRDISYPDFFPPTVYTGRVERDQVVHP